MMHFQFDKTKKAVTIFRHCPFGVGSKVEDSLCATAERGRWKYTDPDVHKHQCLVSPGFTDYNKIPPRSKCKEIELFHF